MKKLILSLLFVLGACQPALAQVIPSIPYNLTNGSLADATQVMGNFNTIVTDTNANAATNGANTNITSLTGLTTPLANTYGGTVTYTGGTSTGSANAQVVATTVPSNFALTAGNVVTFTAGFPNTTATTLNVEAQGAKALDKITASGVVALAGSELISTGKYSAMYDGTEFLLMNPSTPILAQNNLSDLASASVSINNILPLQSGNSGQFLTTGGTNTSWAAVVAPVQHLQTFISSGNFTAPSATLASTSFKFIVTGAGGGSAGSTTGAAGSGSAGGTAIYYISGLTASSNYVVTVGTGGTLGSSSPTAGGNGGDSSVVIGATTVTGGGGVGGTTGRSDGRAGGTATNGTLNILGGGSGSSGNATDNFSGAGGASFWGGGGQGRSQGNVAGAAGEAYGSGASGAVINSSGSAAGAAGANGVVVVEWVL